MHRTPFLCDDPEGRRGATHFDDALCPGVALPRHSAGDAHPLSLPRVKQGARRATVASNAPRRRNSSTMDGGSGSRSTSESEIGVTRGVVVVVVVVDSHIQRIVLATEQTTVTQQVSPRPIKYQSRLWSQRGTKVNGSHHGDNPLLRPTGIQIATKSYAALQAMAPTNIKTVHQTSLLHIESNLDRLGMLSPTHDQRSQQKTGKITLQPVLINKSKFLKATHFVQK